MNKYTPGPWHVNKIGNDYDQWMIYAEGRTDNIVDSCNGSDNATLMAAAPEMRSALDAIRRDCLEVASGREPASAEFWHAIISRADRAIAKGGAQ